MIYFPVLAFLAGRWVRYRLIWMIRFLTGLGIGMDSECRLILRTGLLMSRKCIRLKEHLVSQYRGVRLGQTQFRLGFMGTDAWILIIRYGLSAEKRLPDYQEKCFGLMMMVLLGLRLVLIHCRWQPNNIHLLCLI